MRLVLPWHRRSSYEPDAPARGVPQSPRWRVGLVCARMRNFLAGVIFWPCERGQDVGSLTMRQQDRLKNLPTFLLFLLSQRRGLGDDCLVAIYTWQQGGE